MTTAIRVYRVSDKWSEAVLTFVPGRNNDVLVNSTCIAVAVSRSEAALAIRVARKAGKCIVRES